MMLNVRPLRTVIFRAILIGAASLLLAGCSSSNSDVDSAKPGNLNAGPGQVTLYVEGMNQRLKILWGDWPNTVKQALLELDGVTSVEDEWEREIESDQDLDLLFVEYEKELITVAQLMKTIQDHKFPVEVKDEG